MTSVSWLHLTDLHMGMNDQEHSLPHFRDRLFEDLKRLFEKCGAWDLVLFTGDFTQKGDADEFKKVNFFLEDLWENHFKKWDRNFNPKLLAVPGNHDLARPQSVPSDPEYFGAVNRLRNNWENDSDLQKEFWDYDNVKVRQVVKDAFKNYQDWWVDQIYRPKESINIEGVLPGDFSYTFKKSNQDEIKIGFVGLNTSFLQLTAADYNMKLDCNIRQFNKVCNGSGPQWTRNHHVCLLMTHHPIGWLCKKSQEDFRRDIFSTDYFAVHLYGHMHEPFLFTGGQAGSPIQISLQSRSLFGLEKWKKNDEEYENRLHGYTFCKIDLSGNQGNLKIYPRSLMFLPSKRKIVPDHHCFDLEDDEHTEPTLFKLNQPAPLQQIGDGKTSLPSQEIDKLRKDLIEKYEELGDWKEQHKKWQSVCTEVIKAGSKVINKTSLLEDVDLGVEEVEVDPFEFWIFRSHWIASKTLVEELLSDFEIFLDKRLLPTGLAKSLIKKIVGISERIVKINLNYKEAIEAVAIEYEERIRRLMPDFGQSISENTIRNNFDSREKQQGKRQNLSPSKSNSKQLKQLEPEQLKQLEQLRQNLTRLKSQNSAIKESEDNLNKLYDSGVQLIPKNRTRIVKNDLQGLIPNINDILQDIDNALQKSIEKFEKALRGETDVG